MGLEKILLIVDGPTEDGALRAYFNKYYQACPAFRKGPGNGIDFTIEGYTKGVLPTLMLILSSDIRAIIIIPDLEKRKEKNAVFSTKLKKSIIDAAALTTKLSKEHLESVIHVCSADIMFENWIISDVESIKEVTNLINTSAKQKYFDGKNGASELQKIMKIKYKKTVHAQLLFKKTRSEISAQNSPSFKNFISCFNMIKEKLDQ